MVGRKKPLRARRKRRVLLLCHESLIPPPGVRGYDHLFAPVWRTEFDVHKALRGLGHETLLLGTAHDIHPVLAACRDFKPEVVFNLMVEFHGDPAFDQHLPSLFELLEIPYTGCRPRGLTLSRDKALSKQILAEAGVDVPRFQTFPMGAPFRLDPKLPFPAIVKSRTEEASLGIGRVSIVSGERSLARRVAFMHESLGTDAIAEEYLDGREFYSAVIEGPRPRVMPPWELFFSKNDTGHPRIATRAIKFSPAAQERLGVWSDPARLPKALVNRIARTARQTWDALDLNGYARIDLRLTEEGRLSVLEANPNPEIARREDFADAAQAGGLSYPALIQRLLDLALA